MSTELLTDDELPPPAPPPAPRSRLTLGLVAVVVVVLAAMAGLSARASSRQNQVALSAAPRAVTVVAARPSSFREERRYVGVVEPWVEARVGPEFVSAWVDTVLVRPGDRVKRNDVLATLDCRNASTNTENAVQQARSLEERQRAMASEAARLENLLSGGFVSANEIDQKKAQAAAAQAQLDGLRAQLRSRTLEAGDCTLRAPFDGEVAARHADPGAFARPGTPLVTLIDRHVVRVVFDVPEIDFPLLERGAAAEVTLLATGQVVTAALTRRAPAASASSRTLRLEIDLDGAVQVPVGTSVSVRFEVGQAKDALEVPLVAAKVRGQKATVFVVDRDVVHKLQVGVVGERGGSVFLSGLANDARVVTEGRAALSEGDHVASKLDASWPPPAPPSVPNVGSSTGVGLAGGGRP